MAKARRENTVRVLGVVRRNRPTLMISTALQSTVMLVLALPAYAQPAPNARPIGGNVVAGSAVISRSSNSTQIDQSSQRAAINWRSFDVGSQQQVTFNQPSASAVALNRVTGPDPSQIAGRIVANGQIILVNQSGVNFYKGAQVNAAGVMVSAANISNQNFMAGVMKFDKPGNPNAKIDNQGTITIRQAGLAALVAPQVANSGTISAKLGHVVLAGAETATLDLYGDGLLSLDVTNQVTKVPVGRDGKAATALVTNTGLIIADGGTVQLTARAADGIVQNLMRADGTIRAATIGDRTGIVALDGVGGSIVVGGHLAAPGSAPGTIGGDIQVVTNRNVTLASTAKVDASGKSGGGVVAIGTGLARAKGGPSVSATQTAANVTIQQGTTITADARGSGNGGRVAVLSTGTTLMDSSISAKGGPQGGNGGWVETSGKMLGVGNNAVVDVGAQAPSGQPGTWLLDPLDITVTTIDQNTSSSKGTFTGSADPATIANTTLQTALGTGNVIISTTGSVTADNGNITVSAPVTWTSSNSLTLLADGNLTVNSPIVGGGNVALEAGQSRQSVLTINATVQSGGLVYLTNGFGPTSGDGILINASVGSTRPQAQQGPLITVACDCFMNNGAGGSLDAVNGTVEFGPLSAGQQFKIGGTESFINANLYRFGQTHDPLTGAPGKIAGSLTMGDGVIDFHQLNLELDTSDTIGQTFGSSMVNVANLSGKAVNSAIFDSSSNSIVSFGSFTVSNGSLLLKDSAPLTVSGPVSAGADISLVSAGPLTISSDLTAPPKTGSLDLVAGATMTQTTGSITGNKLTGSASSAAFMSSPNQINNLGPFATSSGFSLSDSVPLTVVGAVSTGSGGSIALRTDRLTISAPVTAQNGTVAIAPLTTARGMSLDSTRSGTTLSLLQSDLNQINAGTVALGSMDGGANLLAASLTVNSPMTFNGIAGTLGLFASGNISEVGAGALTVATLTGRTGTNALLAGSNSINALGNFVAASGFTLIDAPGLTVNADSAVNGGTNVTIIDSGLLTITGSVLGTTVDLTGSNIDIPGSVDGPTSVSLKATPGGLTETGSLATALLTGSAATSATLSGATPTANLISNLGPFTDTSGGFSLATAGPLTVAGAVTTKGNVSLQATGDLSVSNPVVAADSNIVMHAGHNLTISTPLSASGILYLKANTANDPANPGNFMINAPVSGGTVYLASTSNLGIKIDQPVTSTGASPLITVACDCLIKSDPPLPQVLLQAPGGTIEYGPATNGFNQTIVTHDENVFEAALLRFGLSHDPINGTQALAGTLTVGDIAGAISLDGRALDLNASGAITQRAGTFFTDVATLTGAAGSANLTEVSNAIATLGAFSTTAGFALVNNKPLLVAGPVQDTGGASTLALTTKTGDIALAGNVNATNVVDLISAGAISQTGGSLIAGTLTGSAATSASLTQPTNLIDALGAFSTTAGFALVNNKPLLVAGPVQDTGGASTLALATKTGDIALAGNVSATNVVDLISAGAISQTGGSLVARALTGSAGSSSGVTLTSDNVISFFGPFTATSGAIELMDSIPLTINGALTARLIFITATGSISLASDITTGGLASLTTVPTDPLASLGGALFFVAPDLNGNSSFTASTSVSSLSDTGTLLFVSMPPQVGNVGLTNLNAPDTELLLNLGSGNASGQVNVGSLFVLGAGGQVNFTNSTVQGLTGSAAALVAQSFPAANSAYLINGCEIGVGCGSIIGPPQRPPESLSPLLSPELLAQGVSVSTGISNIVSSLVDDASIAPFQSSQETNPRGVPVLNPMRDLFSGPLRDRQDDPDLLLPNVSEKDY